MSHTEQDLATLILNRYHELGSAGVAKNDRFNDRYLQQYEAELAAVRRAISTEQRP